MLLIYAFICRFIPKRLLAMALVYRVNRSKLDSDAMLEIFDELTK